MPKNKTPLKDRKVVIEITDAQYMVLWEALRAPCLKGTMMSLSKGKCPLFEINRGGLPALRRVLYALADIGWDKRSVTALDFRIGKLLNDESAYYVYRNGKIYKPNYRGVA